MMQTSRFLWVLAAALAVAAPAVSVSQTSANTVESDTGVIGVRQEMLNPDYWIARTRHPNQVLLSAAAIARLNQQTLQHDPTLIDITTLGDTATREQVTKWLNATGDLPAKPLVDAKGDELSAATMDAIRQNTAADAIPASVSIRYGLSVDRAQLKLRPTDITAYPVKGLTDFESFQGGVLFPGDPVAVVHESADHNWFLVLTTQGAAWVRPRDIALGDKAEVLGYLADREAEQVRVITGDQVSTVFTPEAPEVSQVQLDMGTKLPLARMPANQTVNGEGSYVSWTLRLPVRKADGSLGFEPALLRKTSDTSNAYLPFTRANLIRQAFKFLGERYGWGHLYDARDCSGFTSDVYQSMGVLLPPNSGAQGRSPAIEHQLFSAADSHQQRMDAIAKADVGDLIVVPGHVLMILGRIDHQPYVIQDVPFAVYHNPDGSIHQTKLNEVSVTPLLPLLADADHSYIDAMTSLVHIRAARDESAAPGRS